jgi:hypothetical protein
MLVVVPHRCRHPRPPHCDVNSAEMARQLAPPERVLVSTRYRHECDPNRASCHDDELRRQLRAWMAARPDTRILEVHSFPRETLGAQWPLPRDTLAVVLTMHGSEWEQAVLRAAGARALAGDPVVNDIGHEAAQRGWTHALLELRYDLIERPEWARTRAGLEAL